MLTLLYPYPSLRLPCCALIFLRTYSAVPYFTLHLPCYALIFLRSYPAVPLFFCALILPCSAPIFFSRTLRIGYLAVPLKNFFFVRTYLAML